MGQILDKTIAGTAKVAWPLLQAVNRLFPEGKPFKPKWADKPLLKSYQRIKPKLGWPRETDSLCPQCVKEVRADIFSGKESVDILRNGKPGEIKAKIIERDGKVWMIKDCPKHGHFEDIMA